MSADILRNLLISWNYVSFPICICNKKNVPSVVHNFKKGGGLFVQEMFLKKWERGGHRYGKLIGESWFSWWKSWCGDDGPSKRRRKKKRLYLKRTSVGKEMRVGWIDGWGSTIPHYLQGFIVGGLGCLPFCSIHTHSYDKLIELAIGYSVSKVLAAAAATLAFKEEIEMCIQ